MADLADANWKTRLAALEELTTWIEAEIEILDAEVVIRALAKKGWGEKNFQVGSLKFILVGTELFLGLCQTVWDSQPFGG
jgi:cytoskeleton-associated protein 5